MPVLNPVTKLFAITDMKVAKMTADPIGGAATYAASIDVPGVKKLAVGGSVSTKSLRGDNTLLDADATLEGVSAVVDHAKLSTDLLNILFGGAVTDSGTAPNQVKLFRLLGGTVAPSTPAFFKIEAKAVDTDILAGDCHLILWKCKIDAFPPLGFNEEDYELFNFSVQSMPRQADGFWMDVLYNETAAAIT
jgi:hypothetical protein